MATDNFVVADEESVHFISRAFFTRAHFGFDLGLLAAS
jgi:hypothetical protein